MAGVVRDDLPGLQAISLKRPKWFVLPKGATPHCLRPARFSQPTPVYLFATRWMSSVRCEIRLSVVHDVVVPAIWQAFTMRLIS